MCIVLLVLALVPFDWIAGEFYWYSLSVADSVGLLEMLASFDDCTVLKIKVSLKYHENVSRTSKFKAHTSKGWTLKALFTSISGQWFGYNDYNDYKWTYFPNINHKMCDETKILPVNEVLWSYLRGTIISFILFPGPWFSDFSWIMKIVKYCIGWFGTFLLIVRTAWLPTGRNWIYDGGNVKHNWADHRCCSSTFGWNSWLIILMQSFRTGCGKHNKLINAFVEIIFNA